MKILELHLIEFGALKDRRITLSEGLNLLEGENESGKSTLLLFIKFMLYGLGRKNQEDYERSVSRSGHCAKGSMTLRSNGEDYRIERIFAEGARSGSERLRVLRLSDGEEVFAGMQPGEALLKVSREVFENSCCIGQMRVQSLSEKKGSDAIRNLLSSADETTDISRIEDKLDKIRVAYRHKTGKGGKLYEMSEAIALERTRLDRALDAHRRVVKEQGRYDRAHEQTEQNNAQLERLNQLLTQLGKLEILRRFERLHQSESEHARLRDARERARMSFLKTETMPTFSDVAALRHCADNLEQAEVRVGQMREKLSEHERFFRIDETLARHAEQLSASGGLEALARRQKKLGARIAILAVLCGLFGVAVIPLVLYLPLFAVLPALGIIPCVIGIFSTLGRRRKLATEYDKKPSELLSYAEECEEYSRKLRTIATHKEQLVTEQKVAEEQLRLCGEGLREALLRTVPADHVTVSAEAARAEADRIERYLQADREAQIREQSIDRMIDGERKSLDGYAEETLRAEVDESLWKMTPDEIARAEREQKFYLEKKRTLEQTMHQAQLELISARANFTSPVEIADRLEKMTDALGRSERYADALSMAIEGLQSAAKSMSKSMTPTLAKDASVIMETISDGRYAELSTGTQLIPSLVGEDGLSVPVELMSGGTRDAAYLSLRIALMMRLYEGELPPLLLDESLCQMDDRRVERILDLLGRLSADRTQCLLFTCHRRESRICSEQGIEHCVIAL